MVEEVAYHALGKTKNANRHQLQDAHAVIQWSALPGITSGFAPAMVRKEALCSGVPRTPTASPDCSTRSAPGLGITSSPRTTARIDAPVSLLTPRSPMVRPRRARF